MRLLKSLVLAVVLAAAAVIGWTVLRGPRATQSGLPSTPAGAQAASLTRPAAGASRRSAAENAIWFADVTEASGVTFHQTSGTTAEKYGPTAFGSGVGMIDFDQDGRIDLYFGNAREFPLIPRADAPRNALYRQRPDGAFEDISAFSGLDLAVFGHGIAVGDVDNDGFPDVFLANFGSAELLHNNGDGTFESWTARSGLADPRWNVSAAFLDFDGDGNLDLYVARYAQWTLETHVPCGTLDPRDSGRLKVLTYCHPRSLTPERHSLYRSLGDGRFVDVTAELEIARIDGRGQGVVAADVNHDGWIDLYVANDGNPNFLFVNNGRGGFLDLTEHSGAALNSQGMTEAGMGADAGDVDGDGLPELFVTNFFNEHNTLYRNLGKNLFIDVSESSGVAAGSRDKVGWGTALEDFDQDGWLDILVVNGHVDDNMELIGRAEPYREPTVVWRNLGRGAFEKCQNPGPYFQTEHVSRGAAFGDLDNDGAVDVVITHKDERPTILHNDSRSRRGGPPNAWIQLRLVGTAGNRDAVGASVQVQVGPQVISRQVMGGRSYMSASDLRLTIGLGQVAEVERITLRWPSGATCELTRPTLGQLHTVREPRQN